MGKLGMHEMELAAARIKEHGHVVGIDDMKSALERVGFVNLAYYGWLKKGNYNSEFVPTDALLEKLK